MRRIAFSLLLAGLAAPLFAQDAGDVPPPPPMPESPAETPAPPPDTVEELVEPQVTIIRREHETIEEYRVSGQLYMVRITPRSGPPYFLIDTDGDGSLETRRNELSNPEIPQWVLFRW
ncbi:MAG: DUF2782 domain-containing protein [Thiohalomonadaceae bacterium]